MLTGARRHRLCVAVERRGRQPLIRPRRESTTMPDLDLAKPPDGLELSGDAQHGSLGRNPQPTIRHIMGRIDRALRSRLNTRLERLELTTPGYTMLFVLRRMPGLTNAELARTAGMTPQSSILTLQALVERELVERRPSTTHKRVLHNFLTPTGSALIEHCEAEAAEIEATMLQGFGGHERQQVEVFLRRCAENLGISL